MLLALRSTPRSGRALAAGTAAIGSQVWGRWPSAGPTAPFGSAAQYTLITEQTLHDTVLDHGMLYFDARPSHHHPTIEVRVADVCREPRDALLLAALTRGLVETAAREWAAGEPAAPVRTELLRGAPGPRVPGIDDWAAETTEEPDDGRRCRRGTRLLDHIAQGPTDAGDARPWPSSGGICATVGPGAHHQRRAHREHGLLGVVHDALAVAGRPADR